MVDHQEECHQSEIFVSRQNEEYVCELFKMLGDPGRLKVVCALMGTSMCVAHLAGQVDMEQSALSHQLRNLKNAGIVRAEKKGKQVFYSLDDAHVFAIIKQAVEHAEHTKRSI